MRSIRVFSRRGCHLCEVLIEELLPLVQDVFRVEVCDVDTDPELRDRYGNRVPVVEFDGRMVCQHRLDVQAVRELVSAWAPDD